MIFAHKGYAKLGNDTPFKGSWDEWVKLINDDQSYCKNLRYTKPITKVKVHELPSWHPYWDKVVKERENLANKQLKEKYKLCKNDPNLIKIYFNATTQLKDIRKLIKNYSK